MDAHNLKLPVAESITTGNLQAAIGSISGFSTYFEGGMTVYSREQKVSQLGINDEHAKECNSVSPRVAEELARGVCLRYDTDIGIGTTATLNRTRRKMLRRRTGISRSGDESRSCR
jgi:PncC family amidohydrolase